MSNYLFKIKFDGSCFHGWQSQKNAITVQDTLSSAFDRILSIKPVIIGCSRTDAGVHANEFCFNTKIETDLSVGRLIYSLNAVLPHSVKIFACEKVDDTFHARYDASAKEYIYLINNSHYPDPFYYNRAYYYPYNVDMELVSENAKDFIGEHDFISFCASGSSVKNTVRKIHEFVIEKQQDLVILRVKGNGFLYNMVRIMAGTLLDINEGRIPSGAIPEIIESKQRKNAGVTAPACGLYLNKVFYGGDKI